MRLAGLLLGAALLLTGVAAELLPVYPRAVSPPKAAPATPRPPDSRIAGRFAAGGGAKLDGLLARPPFDPTRLPPRDAPSPMTLAVPTLPRLSGIAMNDEDRMATFTDTGVPGVVREGDRLGSFTVLRIAPGEVTMRGPGGQRVIHTALAPTPPELPASPAVPAAELPLQQRSAAGPLPYNSMQLKPPGLDGDP